MSYFHDRMAEIDAERKSKAPEPKQPEPVPVERPWLKWTGRGPQPVPDHVMVEVMFRNGHYSYGTAGQLSRKYQGKEIAWRHVGDGVDIVSWRLLPAPGAPT